MKTTGTLYHSFRRAWHCGLIDVLYFLLFTPEMRFWNFLIGKGHDRICFCNSTHTVQYEENCLVWGSLDYRPLLSPPSFLLRISWALIFFPLWSMFYYVNRLTTDTKPAFLAVFKTEILVLWLRNHLMPRSDVFLF